MVRRRQRDRPAIDVQIDLRWPTSTLTVTATEAGATRGLLVLETSADGEVPVVEQIRSTFHPDPYRAVGASADHEQGVRAWGLASAVLAPDADPYAALGILQALGRVLDRCRVEHLAAVLDLVTLRRWSWQLPEFFAPVPGTSPLPLGGPFEERQAAVWCDLRQWRRRMLAEEPTLVRWFLEGTPSVPAITAPEWHALDPYLELVGTTGSAGS